MKNSVRFISTYMGQADYEWERDGKEPVRIRVRYLEPSDYELSISMAPDEIPPVGTVTCPDETIPSEVLAAIWVGNVWEHLSPIEGYKTAFKR